MARACTDFALPVRPTQFVGRVLCGLAACGAWTCLDEFNRLPPALLAVVSAQLLALQASLRARAERVCLNGRIVPLVATPNAGIFVTCNPVCPGYSGRRELPDGLRVSALRR